MSKWELKKPLRKKSKKEREQSRAMLVEAFYKEYGKGVFNSLQAEGLIKWRKK